MIIFHTRRIPRTAVAAIIALFGLSLHACSAQTTSETSVQTIRHEIETQYRKRARTISVQLPASYHDGGNLHYPVLYILDGNQNLELTTSVVGSLVDEEKMPEVIIVGVIP